MAAAWDPAGYEQFKDFRLRPALDLMAAVDPAAPGRVPGRIYDLGCGTGRATGMLLERWPEARVTGIDGSKEMLAQAKARGMAVEWIEADLNLWAPDRPADLLFSNAALHWLDDHRNLFRRLMSFLKPDGVLAVQMPKNYARPSHTEMAAAAVAGPWASILQPLLRPAPVAEADFYRQLLAPLSASTEVWETEYDQELAGETPVVDWMAGAALKPLLDALDGGEGGEREGFLADYSARTAAAYPKDADGITRFSFNRIFIVAVK